MRRESEVAGGRVALPGPVPAVPGRTSAAMRRCARWPPVHLDVAVPPGRLRFTRFDWTLGLAAGRL